MIWLILVTFIFFVWSPAQAHEKETSEFFHDSQEVLRLQAMVQQKRGSIPLFALPVKIQKTIDITLSEFFNPVFKLAIFSESERYEQARNLLRPYFDEKIFFTTDASPDVAHATLYLNIVPLVSTSFGHVCLHYLQQPNLRPLTTTPRPSSLATCTTSLKKLAQQESLLLSLWKEEKSAERQAIAQLYTSSQKSNRSAYRQQIVTLATLARPVMLLACSTAGAMGAFYLGMYACNTPVMDSHLYKVSTITAVSTTPALMKEFKNQEIFFKTIRYLHLKMNALATVVPAINACTQLITEYPELKQLPHAQLLIANKHQASPMLKKLFNLLKTPTFSGKPSFCSHYGRVRAAYFLFLQTKTELIPLLTALGEVDAYLASYKAFQRST